MMNSVSTIAFALCFSILGLTAAAIVAEDPKSVEEWFQKLPHAKEKMAKFNFYLHDVFSGKNQTAFQIARSNISATSLTSFGSTFVLDDALRVGSSPGSKIIGRAQCIDAFASLDELSLLFTLNFVFTEGKYNGSTLTVFGRNAILHKYREMPIVGGTGVFRLARGIATAETYLFNTTYSKDLVVEFNVMVIHY